MHPVLASLAVCTLFAAPLAAQETRIAIPTPDGPRDLKVRVIAGLGDKVAMAAEKGAESDGVMVVPMPGSDFALRTTISREGCDVTAMVAAANPNAPAGFADSSCSSTWISGARGEHRLETSLREGESGMAWGQRHVEGLSAIGMVYPVEAGARAQPAPAVRSRMDMAATDWTDARGVRHEVTTRRRANEDRDAWMLRHQRAVEAFAGLMPPRA